VVVIETAGIAEFFEEYRAESQSLRQKRAAQKQALADLASVFEAAEEADVARFLDDDDWRRSTFKILSKFSAGVVREFGPFFERCLAEAKRRSGPTGAFQHYATTLHLLLDFLTAFESDKLPPSLVYVAVRSFDRLAPNIGGGHGQSWAAQQVWEQRKAELPEATLAELRVVARQYGAGALRALLKKA
jgi:hypothetical protein